jgi:hypothetical protein
MWKMIFALWLLPICVAIVAAKRAASGTHPVKGRERRVLFRQTGHAGLSPWFWIAFVILAIGFFALGVVQAVILLNFANFWAVAAATLTGILAAASLLVLFRFRLFYRRAPRRMSTAERRRQRAAYSPDF